MLQNAKIFLRLDMGSLIWRTRSKCTCVQGQRLRLETNFGRINAESGRGSCTKGLHKLKRHHADVHSTGRFRACVCSPKEDTHPRQDLSSNEKIRERCCRQWSIFTCDGLFFSDAEGEEYNSKYKQSPGEKDSQQCGGVE